MHDLLIPPLPTPDPPKPSSPGAIAGLLAARYLAPALVWGGVSEGSNGGINPDSKAKSWAVRREALTNQYVSRLADQAAGKGRAALDSNGTGDEMKDGSGRGPVTKNLSQLSAGALTVCTCVVCCDILSAFPTAVEMSFVFVAVGRCLRGPIYAAVRV